MAPSSISLRLREAGKKVAELMDKGHLLSEVFRLEIGGHDGKMIVLLIVMMGYPSGAVAKVSWVSGRVPESRACRPRIHTPREGSPSGWTAPRFHGYRRSPPRPSPFLSVVGWRKNIVRCTSDETRSPPSPRGEHAVSPPRKAHWQDSFPPAHGMRGYLDPAHKLATTILSSKGFGTIQIISTTGGAKDERGPDVPCRRAFPVFPQVPPPRMERAIADRSGACPRLSPRSLIPCSEGLNANRYHGVGIMIVSNVAEMW